MRSRSISTPNSPARHRGGGPALLSSGYGERLPVVTNSSARRAHRAVLRAEPGRWFASWFTSRNPCSRAPADCLSLGAAREPRSYELVRRAPVEEVWSARASRSFRSHTAGGRGPPPKHAPPPPPGLHPPSLPPPPPPPPFSSSLDGRSSKPDGIVTAAVTTRRRPAALGEHKGGASTIPSRKAANHRCPSRSSRRPARFILARSPRAPKTALTVLASSPRLRELSGHAALSRVRDRRVAELSSRSRPRPAALATARSPVVDHSSIFTSARRSVFHVETVFTGATHLPPTSSGTGPAGDFYISDTHTQHYSRLLPLVMPSVRSLWSDVERLPLAAAAVVRDATARGAVSAFRIPAKAALAPQFSCSRTAAVLARSRILRAHPIARFPRGDRPLVSPTPHGTIEHYGR